MKGKSKYISEEDYRVMQFLYGLYQDEVEGGAWSTDDDRESVEQNQFNKELHARMARFRKKFSL